MDKIKKLNNVTGNMTLRMPKSLHQKLVELAEREGVSLNQYCVYILSEHLSNNMLGKKELNHKLVSIREKHREEDFTGLIEDIKTINEYVQKLKPVIEREVNDMINSRKSRLTSNDELYLETKFPVIGGSVFGEIKPRIKTPTLKLIITPRDGSNLDDNELKKSFDTEEFKDKVIFCQNNIDEIGEHCVLNYTCKVIFILEEDIDKIEKYMKKIKLNLEKSMQKDKFKISYAPTYILSSLN